MGVPTIPNLEEILSMGFNPKTGLPLKFDTKTSINPDLKNQIKRQIRIMDEQDAVRRFKWYNLPYGLNEQLLERILYYKGQGILFKLDEIFCFLPYALTGTIDIYGRYKTVKPLPFTGTSDNGDDKKFGWLTAMEFNPVYDVQLPEHYFNDNGEVNIEKIKKAMNESCVILNDYTPQMAQSIIPRQQLQEPILDVMASMLCYLNTSMSLGAGVKGVRVQSQDEFANVLQASAQINNSALDGRAYVPMLGDLDFQDLGQNVPHGISEDYLLTFQALNNYRLSLLGLGESSFYEKKAHILESEQQANAGMTSIILTDGLENRQTLCDIANSIWGTAIWCEPAEEVAGVDIDQNGIIGSQSNAQPAPENEQEVEE